MISPSTHATGESAEGDRWIQLDVTYRLRTETLPQVYAAEVWLFVRRRPIWRLPRRWTNRWLMAHQPDTAPPATWWN